MTTIGTSGGKFTINGAPTFLLMCTYFDAIHARESDLAEFRARGINYLRLMLAWPSPSYAAGAIFNSDGTLKTTEKATLLAFIRAADALGIVCELVILHDGVDAFLTTGTDRTNAIVNACTYFGGEPNVTFDVCNEIDLASGTWATTFASWDALLDTAQANTSALCYVSVAPSAVEADGPFIHDTTDVIDASFMTSWMNTSTDACTPHFKGNAQWWWSKGRRVANLRAWLDANGHSAKPIHINEDNRWGTGYGDAGAGDISADKYLTTMLEAQAQGAASWTFHSNASYDMNSAATFEALFDEETEREIYNRMGRTLAAGGIITPMQLRDAFDRANEGPPPSSDWVVCAGTGLKVSSNVAIGDATGEQASSWGGYFYHDQEASFVIATTNPPDGAFSQSINLRLAKIHDFTSDHYEVSFSNSGGLGRAAVYLVQGGYTQLGATIVFGSALVIGSRCRARVVGPTISVYLDDVLQDTRTDLTIRRGGAICLRTGDGDNGINFDTFYAGALFEAFQTRQFRAA